LCFGERVHEGGFPKNAPVDEEERLIRDDEAEEQSGFCEVAV